jgi:hypothetical protein
MVFGFVGLFIHVVRSSKPWKVCNVGGCEWNMNAHALLSYTLLFVLLQRMRPAGRNTISLLHKRNSAQDFPLNPRNPRQAKP